VTRRGAGNAVTGLLVGTSRVRDLRFARVAIRPAAEAPTTFDYVGPIFEKPPDSGWRAPWPPDDPRPLVVVSFPTGADQRTRIERTLAGLAGRPYRVLVTSSGSDVAGLEVPANAALVRYVPHAEVLPGAAATVSHGGHGTVSASLACGVPLVLLPNPLIADQLPLAARVEALGAGRALDGEAATAAAIAAAVNAVVADIAALPGAAPAAARLERLAAAP
jgi:UDP:flavonoid glycosyltransferase YjiC (YdhE family)